MLTIHSVTPHYYTGAKVLIQDGNNRLSVNSEGHFVPYTYNCFYLAYFFIFEGIGYWQLWCSKVGDITMP